MPIEYTQPGDLNAIVSPKKRRADIASCDETADFPEDREVGAVMRYRLLVATVALVYCHNSSRAVAESYATFGEGTQSCGAYVQAAERERRTGLNPGYINDRNYIGFPSFTNGYLSGANRMAVALGRSGNVASRTDIEGRMIWVENWCRQHPLSMFTDAVSELVDFLNQRNAKE